MQGLQLALKLEYLLVLHDKLFVNCIELLVLFLYENLRLDDLVFKLPGAAIQLSSVRGGVFLNGEEPVLKRRDEVVFVHQLALEAVNFLLRLL